MAVTTRRALLLGLLAAPALSACTDYALRPRPAPNAPAGFASWNQQPPEYRLQPGDDIEIKFEYVSERNDRQIVGPDGRIVMPLVGVVTAEGRSVTQLARELEQRYAPQMRDPRITVILRATSGFKVFVGGDVGQPGAVTLTGRVGAMEAIVLAGGFRDTARLSEVVLIRRGPDNRPMLRTLDMRAFLSYGAMDVPLMPYDIVYVPRSAIGEVNLWIDQFINQVLPFNRGFSYTINRNRPGY